MKKIIVTLAALAVFHGCTSTPSIQTHHKTIPSKKNEYAAIESSNTQQAPSTIYSPFPAAVAATPQTAIVSAPQPVVVVPDVKHFDFSE